jgi:hypothetical protein
MTAHSSGVLSVDQRQRLAELADHVVGGGAGLPSASEAEVHTVWIDRAIAVRPDLADPVMDAVNRSGTPAEVAAHLREKEPDAFNAFAFAVAGAYLINPHVRELLGFPGALPEKNPAFPDEAEAYLEGGLLDPVIQRGPIWRHAPR